MNTYFSILKTVKQSLIISGVVLLSFAPVNYADSSFGFALSEHWEMGQQVKLRFSANLPAKSTVPLHLPNGLALTYGDIISLGDLYGVIGKPISLGKNNLENQERFKEAFKSFAKKYSAINEVKKLIHLAELEALEIDKEIKLGKAAEDIFKQIANEVGRQLNCITGGSCKENEWWLYPGRYLYLAMENYDHFSPNNLTAYNSGHQIALKQALKAHKTGKRSDLELAYAIDAFAAHFLSDRFASGHLRTPRLELKNKIKPAVLGSLLSHYMHNEENKYGLHVHNDLGEHWFVYGDFSYFNPYNQTNREMLLKTLQQSADELFETFYTGEVPRNSKVLSMVPQTDLIDDETSQDIAPMFYWDDKTQQLLRRTDLSNPYDRHWTSNWWGWSTLLILKNQQKLGSTIQINLAQYLSQFQLEEMESSVS